jgi:hypothetical protein
LPSSSTTWTQPSHSSPSSAWNWEADINDTVARLRAHGAELLGEVAQYVNIHLLCYLRGAAGIIVALAEQIG